MTKKIHVNEISQQDKNVYNDCLQTQTLFRKISRGYIHTWQVNSQIWVKNEIKSITIELKVSYILEQSEIVATA